MNEFQFDRSIFISWSVNTFSFFVFFLSLHYIIIQLLFLFNYFIETFVLVLSFAARSIDSIVCWIELEKREKKEDWMNKHVVEKYCISIIFRLFYIYMCIWNELFYKSIKYNGVIGSILFSHLFVGIGVFLRIFFFSLPSIF